MTTSSPSPFDDEDKDSVIDMDAILVYAAMNGVLSQLVSDFSDFGITREQIAARATWLAAQPDEYITVVAKRVAILEKLAVQQKQVS